MFARLSFCFAVVLAVSCYAEQPNVDTTEGDDLVGEYFRQQSDELTARTFAENAFSRPR